MTTSDRRGECRRYRTGEAARRSETNRTQRQADFLTLQIFTVVLMLCALWAVKMFQPGWFANVRRMGTLILDGDPAVLDELRGLLPIDSAAHAIRARFPIDWENLFRLEPGPAAPAPAQTPPETSSAPGDPAAPSDPAAPEAAAMGGVYPGSLESITSSPPRSATFTPLLLSAKPQVPVAGAVTSGFGWRDNPLSPGSADFHTGLDIAAAEGSVVYAALPGAVEDTGFSESYGNYVLVGHAGGLQTFYCHCSEIIARTGEKIRAGERIARVGSTGRVTGPHLHFEIRQDALSNDPLVQLL